VLKVLYESVIGSETRKQRGEYYTPGWLAEQVVGTAVTAPLNQRVLDPACGSGTFLFHAVRRYLDAAVLDRGYYAGFRADNYPDSKDPVAVTFTGPWDLRRLRPHFFPRGAAVVFGQRSITQFGSPLPSQTTRWTGQLPRDNDTWDVVSTHVTRYDADLTVYQETLQSPPTNPGSVRAPLSCPACYSWSKGRSLAAGARRGTPARSIRTQQYRKDAMEGTVLARRRRRDGVHPSYPARREHSPVSGASREAWNTSLEGDQLLHGEHARLDLYPGLADWWRRVEQLWLYHRSSDRLTLRDNSIFARS
jgi:hypothetical protein